MIPYQEVAVDLQSRDQVVAAIEQHAGHLGQLASAAGITRAQLHTVLKVFDLLDFADSRRAGARIRGPRASLPDNARADDAAKAADYRRALVRLHWNNEKARAEFGIPRRSWYRELARLGIHRPDDAERRRQLCAALKTHAGVKSKVAQTLGIARITVDSWCAEFGVDPAEFRPSL